MNNNFDIVQYIKLLEKENILAKMKKKIVDYALIK